MRGHAASMGFPCIPLDRGIRMGFAGRLRSPVVIVAVLSAVVLGACGSAGGSDPDRKASQDRAAQLRELASQARQAGADQTQIALLEGGEITFEQYQAAMHRWTACVRQAGVDVIDNGIDDSRGFPLLDIGISASSPGRTDTQTQAVVDDCEKRYSKWVNYAYQTSGASVEAKDKLFQERRPAYIACLRQHGAHVDDDATRQEAMAAEANLWATDPTVNCQGEVGVY